MKQAKKHVQSKPVTKDNQPDGVYLMVNGKMTLLVARESNETWTLITPRWTFTLVIRTNEEGQNR